MDHTFSRPKYSWIHDEFKGSLRLGTLSAIRLVRIHWLRAVQNPRGDPRQGLLAPQGMPAKGGIGFALLPFQDFPAFPKALGPQQQSTQLRFMRSTPPFDEAFLQLDYSKMPRHPEQPFNLKPRFGSLSHVELRGSPDFGHVRLWAPCRGNAVEIVSAEVQQQHVVNSPVEQDVRRRGRGRRPEAPSTRKEAQSCLVWVAVLYTNEATHAFKKHGVHTL